MPRRKRAAEQAFDRGIKIISANQTLRDGIALSAANSVPQLRSLASRLHGMLPPHAPCPPKLVAYSDIGNRGAIGDDIAVEAPIALPPFVAAASEFAQAGKPSMAL